MDCSIYRQLMSDAERRYDAQKGILHTAQAGIANSEGQLSDYL
jgi:hypothetical protein